MGVGLGEIKGSEGWGRRERVDRKCLKSDFFLSPVDALGAQSSLLLMLL